MTAPARALAEAVAFAALLLVAASALAVAPGGTLIVAGDAVVRYEVATGIVLPAYRNQGFRQEVRDGTVEVLVSARPSWTRARFTTMELPAAEDDVARFARAAAAGAATRAEAVAEVLQAIARQVRYGDDDAAGSAAAVLQAGEARCVGFADLAIAALASLAIPARPARGLLLDPATGEFVPHRWIEVFYPDAGWVFSDPTESVNYVSPYHVLLTPPAEPDPAYQPGAALAAAPLVVAVDDRLRAVDVRPAGRGRLAERRVLRTQYAATIAGRVVAGGMRAVPRQGLEVRLQGGGLQRQARLSPSGGFSFPGLAAGRYRVLAQVGDWSSERQVSVGESELVEVEVSVR